MKRILVCASILTGLCLAVSGCSSLGNLNIVNPTYSIRQIQPHVQLAIPPSMDFDITIGVDNPNPVGLRLDRLDLDLFVNDNHILNSVSNQRVQIPARGVGDVNFRAHVNYNDVKSIFRQVTDVINGNRANYQIRGNAYYDTPAGQMRFPVTVFSQ